MSTEEVLNILNEYPKYTSRHVALTLSALGISQEEIIKLIDTGQIEYSTDDSTVCVSDTFYTVYSREELDAIIKYKKSKYVNYLRSKLGDNVAYFNLDAFMHDNLTIAEDVLESNTFEISYLGALYYIAYDNQSSI